MDDNALFRIDFGFVFTAQIPDDSLGPKGSRCAHCNEPVVRTDQMCIHCGIPLIGPNGFPQILEWMSYDSYQKRDLVFQVYVQWNNRGREVRPNTVNIPLTEDELIEVEKLKGDEAMMFYGTHRILPSKIRGHLR